MNTCEKCGGKLKTLSAMVSEDSIHYIKAVECIECGHKVTLKILRTDPHTHLLEQSYEVMNMRKRIMSITYTPKIEPVQTGECIQTIRKGHQFEVDDSVLIHGWAGTAYRSRWNKRMRVTITGVTPIVVDSFLGIGTQYQPKSNLIKLHPWDSEYVDDLAALDYIDPPTGVELKKVLFKLIDESDGPEWYQIIRWEIDVDATEALRKAEKDVIFDG